MRRLCCLLALAGLLATSAHAAEDFYTGLRAAVERADSTVIRLQSSGTWGEVRQAVQVPVPYTLAVPVTIPPNARFRTAVALRDEFLGQKLVDVLEPTRFRVVWTPDGGAPVTVLDRVVDARQVVADRRWIDVGADLGRFAGTSGTLALQVARVDDPQANGRSFALWGRPNLYDAVAQKAAPNVLFLTLDALRADHLSCYGYPRPTSPNLDRLASEGVRWANAFSNAPMTMPSLAQVMTSRWFPDETSATLLTSLYAAGVPATHAIVRNPYLQSFLSLDARDGFDRMVSIDLWRADKMTRSALEWIDAQRGDRWALWVHYLDTHTPYRTPASEALHFADPAYRGPIGPGFGDVEGAQSGIYDAADRQHIVDLYDGAIRWNDQQVGVLLDGLRQRGLLENTVVVVSADHGEELFDHGSFFHGVSLYDELLRVPLIARFPKGAHAGTVVTEQVSLVDAAPTIAEAAGAPLQPGFQGHSLLGPLQGTPAPPRPVFARAANPSYPWRFGLRTPTHKLIRTIDPPEEQLFDLVADPHERTNLAADPAMAPVLANLREGLATFLAPLADTGVQLRAVAPHGMSSVLEVKVTAEAGNQPIANPDRVGGGATGDRITIAPDGRALTWLVRVPDAPVGIRFDRGVLPTWRGDVQLKFAVRALGAMDLAPRAIFLGPDGVHPPADPFTYTVKPGALFGKPVEDPPLVAPTAPARLEAFVGEPATLWVWRAGKGPVGGAATGGIDDEQRRKLRALGYAE